MSDDVGTPQIASDDRKSGKIAAREEIYSERCSGDLMRTIATRHGITVSRVASICAGEERRRSAFARIAQEPDWRLWHLADCFQLSRRTRNALAELGYTALGDIEVDILSGKLDLERRRHNGCSIPHIGKVTAKEMQDYLGLQQSTQPNTF